ncbi:hypothetical protein LWI29_005240 [Acer saccharum]|uniref:AB hydrolase-1 domain-containing protein n=1 Tax=Acer saccharum TaxID=4024 RepID=A0AA39T188_ACESA|nr:hypothetical protein LWI29_005240 [Acer saccharum]
MAIITEEPEQEPQQPIQKPKANPTNTTKPQNNTNPFTFWFYFTLSVSLVTLIFISLSSLSSSQDPKQWFLSLPSSLRRHYSSGRIIKVQMSPNRSPIELFTFQNGVKSTENVLIVHGLGVSSFSFRGMVESLGSRGVRVIAVDLPGSGFSDRSTMEVAERSDGSLQRLRDVYGLIQEKGIFWAFDQIVETGQIPYEEIMKSRVLERKSVKSIELGSEELGRVLGQVIQTMNLAPVHLVLHDSALLMSANWVSENSGLVKSITLVDTGLKPALPSLVLGLPLIREFLLGSSLAYERLIRSCCVKKIGGFDFPASRVLLKGRDGSRSIAEMGRRLNYSFNIGEWGGSDAIKGLPIQVLWSKEWSEEGRQAAEALSQAKFVEHSGGRWPQEDTADELAENIAEFVSSLPKSVRQTEEEHIPEHIQMMFDKEQAGDHHHDHHNHHSHGGHDHHHGHGNADYMDAYGLGNAWGH